MKKLCFVFALFPVLLSQYVWGQAAGNFIYSQQKAPSARTTSSTNDYYGGESQYYQSNTGYYTAPVLSAKDSVIEITSSVMMNVKADSYIAIFGISQAGDNIDSCHAMVNRRIQRFISSISNLGIKPNETYVDFISQVPIFEYEVEKKLFSKSYNEIPKGFEVKKNIHVKYKAPGIAEKLIIEATRNEIYDIVKVDYIIDDNREIFDSLRNAGITILNKKVKEFKRLGLKFEPKYQTIAEKIYSVYPLDRYSTYTPFNNASVGFINKSNAGKFLANSTTQAPSLYYNKMPYNTFDYIINPEIVEPVVQFVCTLTMKYDLKKQ